MTIQSKIFPESKTFRFCKRACDCKQETAPNRHPTELVVLEPGPGSHSEWSGVGPTFLHDWLNQGSRDDEQSAILEDGCNPAMYLNLRKTGGGASARQ